jgi:hypothetical protein
MSDMIRSQWKVRGNVVAKSARPVAYAAGFPMQFW